MTKNLGRCIGLILLILLPISLACKAVNLVRQATPVPTASPLPAASDTPEGVRAVSNLDDLEKAVLYIETEGTYRDPSEGLKVNVESSGSGFIIDQNGIAVTNNHVVAGASKLRVWVYGESEPRSAIILGTSECSDLAVIDIDGEGFSFLEWYEGEIKAGLDVYTAGFPISGAGIGYTLTKGIVSKPTGSVDWTVASVNHIIEHTAKINPGNSGGPLVTQDAKVLGVNFGANPTLDQNYAVARDEARTVINQLRGGEDVNSLGINGVGVKGDLQGNAVVGVWVRSVKAGSPADQTGIQPGDIITQLDGQNLDDGTLGSYCNVVRSHQSGDAIDVSVIRADTLEVFEGQFNGTALAETGSLESQTTPVGGVEGNPNASQPGEVFFATEFDSADNWYTIRLPNTDQYDAFTEGGKLRLEIQPEKVSLYSFYDLDLANPDVHLETYAQKVAGANTNNISLVCRATSKGWYEFSMTSGGEWRIYLYQNDSFALLASGAAKAINLLNKANQIEATCIGSDLTFIINGTQVGSVNDTTFSTGGQVGVSIWSPFTGLGVEFDYFSATVP
jgi:S1-C subfamily serine protease